jgi:hypothetical protein
MMEVVVDNRLLVLVQTIRDLPQRLRYLESDDILSSICRPPIICEAWIIVLELLVQMAPFAHLAENASKIILA